MRRSRSGVMMETDTAWAIVFPKRGSKPGLLYALGATRDEAWDRAATVSGLSKDELKNRKYRAAKVEILTSQALWPDPDAWWDKQS